MSSIRMGAVGLAVSTVLALTLGCGGDNKTALKGGANTDKGRKNEGHEHGTGPHGGTVADWGGGKYHVEFTVDHPKKEATVYILGSDEKTPVPIKAKDDQLLLSIKEPAFQVT